MSSHELKQVIEGLGEAFEEFRKQSDERLAAIETRANRPGVTSSEGRESGVVAEHRKEFRKFVTKGGNEPLLQELEMKALNTGTDTAGGYAVPETIDRSIEKLLVDISPIRRIAKVVSIGTSDYKKLVNTGGMSSGWVSETDSRPETDTPTFEEVAPPLGEIYCNPAATQHMLDDAFFDVEQWLSEEIAEEIAEKEGAAFVNGDGTNKPKGFLTYPTAATADASRPFGTLQYVPTGTAGDFGSDGFDVLITLIHSLRAGYRNGAVWVMNSNTLETIRKFKDADGNYLWRRSLEDGQPSMLLGYPVVEAEDMPDIAADSFAVAFGNFTRGYTITDRMGTRVLRDPYTNKPYVHFYTTKRTGGGLVNSQAIKLLKFSTT